jgi:hypothetical protein
MNVKLIYDAQNTAYGCMMPQGHIAWFLANWGGLPNGEQRARNRQIWAYALAAMPGRKQTLHGMGYYGQQTRLARALGYMTRNRNGKWPVANHCVVFNNWAGGYMPRDSQRKAKLLEFAAQGMRVMGH